MDGIDQLPLYARRVADFYLQWRPKDVAEMADPLEFFRQKGQEMSTMVNDLMPQLAGTDEQGETYLDKVGRLNGAKMRAEEVAWADLIPPPETDEQTNT